MAFKFTKGTSDGIVVLDLRQGLLQGIDAPGWVDLRVGWLLSVTDAVNNDLTDAGAMVETIGTEPRPFLPWVDRYAIGITDMERAVTFCGFTNRGTGRQQTVGSTKLVTSDIGIGTTNSNYWRPKNEVQNNYTAQIFDDGLVALANGGDGIQQHFVRNVVAVPNYATLLMLRLQRPDTGANARRITMTIPMMPSGHSADVLFTNDPTEALLLANMQNFPETVQQLGPVTLSQVPGAFFLYWPFRHSRLRIHEHGFLQAR